jgi:hypothetical protein
MELVHEKNRNRKERSVKNCSTELILPQSHVNYKEKTVEKGENILPSVNNDTSWELCDRDCISEKHKKKKKKKKKRHVNEWSSSEFHNTKEGQNASALQCYEHLERTEEDVKKLPSCEQEDEAKETHEADHDPELPFMLRKVCIIFLCIYCLLSVIA